VCDRLDSHGSSRQLGGHGADDDVDVVHVDDKLYTGWTHASVHWQRQSEVLTRVAQIITAIYIETC